MNQPAEEKTKPKVSSKAKSGTAAAVSLILASVFALEGGYVNHRNDPGGETNHGITKQVAKQAGYKGSMKDLTRYCETETDVCAESILRQRYIEAPGYMPLVDIDPVVAEEVIDTAVNMGPARPSRYFQAALNDTCDTRLNVDGKIGPITVKAWSDCRQRLGSRACFWMLDSLDEKQRAEYNRLVRVNPRLRVFYRGWINHRINNVRRSRCV